MADAALLIRWDRPVPGREQQALSLFGNSLEYYGTLQSEGAIDSFEPVLLSPVSIDLSGFILLRGSAEQLDSLKRQEQFVEMMIRAEHLIEGFGVIDAYLEGDLQSRMAKYAQVATQ
ncbi:MAG: hypothetical protein JRI98_13365 [Deltaproteobacteria bacterium]|nr:hypothetical protein [Deltaproteobacteria bacterium]